MINKCGTGVILRNVLLVACLAGLFVGKSRGDQENRHLDAVREFADNVLKYGRDTYGPKHTPLFVDGLNVHTHEPVKWIDPDGTKWILSNLASQQNFFRTLDGLSKVTGDPKYRQAAMEAIEYAFENLRSPNGLLYWGHVAAYDAQSDRVWGERHALKLHYPHYELLWKVNPSATKAFIEAFWSAHILDWSNLDMNRSVSIRESVEDPWNHEYDEDGPTFFESSKPGARGLFSTGTSLIHAGAMLWKLSGEEQPLLWNKRLAKRYVETRHPNTGISKDLYNYIGLPLGDDLRGNFIDPRTTIFPPSPFEETRNIYYPENTRPNGWITLLLVDEMLGAKGGQFTQWVLEELTAWGKVSYRKKDNSFIPILTDGTCIEGYVCREDNSNAPRGAIAKPLFVDLTFFWAYSVAYRTTGDVFMWEICRDIGLANSLGDIGRSPTGTPNLQADTTCADVYGLLGLLELYEKTGNVFFLAIAQRIGDNILTKQLHKGFFVPSSKHIYTRFDCLEPLALLHLHTAIKPKVVSVPRVWPSSPLFVPPYRRMEKGIDRQLIYTLTDSAEPPISLRDAAAIGDVGMVISLIEKGSDVDGWDGPIRMTAFHRAAMSNHKDVVELLLVNGANINANDAFGWTPLDYAVDKDHKEVAELLISKGADVNARDAAGDTPMGIAVRRNHRDIVELLVASGAEVTIQAAAYMGDLDKVKSYVEKGISVNVKDGTGSTPLHAAASRGLKEVVELLIARGADVNAVGKSDRRTPLCDAIAGGYLDVAKLLIDYGAHVNAGRLSPLRVAVNAGNTDAGEYLITNGANVNDQDESGYPLLYRSIWKKDKGMVRLLVDKGADVNFTPDNDLTPLGYAVWYEDKDMAELFVAHGAKLEVKDHWGCTALRNAVSVGSRELVEFFVSKGADVSGFHGAAGVGDLDRVKGFVQKGADVDVKDEFNWTPLYWAVSTGQRDVVDFLIAKGASVDVKTRYNITLLHQAVRSGDRKLAELFISKGADVNAKDHRGRTPLWYAQKSGRTEMVELLRKHGAKE